MIPILYEKTKKTFTNDYIGFLTDVIECTVEEGRNDEYELEMTYPISGVLYDSIVQDAIIKAKPNNQDNPQPFRIYKITKNSNMTITVNARHIVYDLSKVTVEPFTSTGTIENAISGMMSHSNPSCDFNFETNKTTAGTYKVSVPSSFRSLMGGVRGSLLDVFGTAEYHYDEYDITLNLNRGSDKGVTIRYGVSMTDLKQEEACEDVYTAVYPFWASGALYMELSERIISVPGQFPFSRIMTLDLTSEWDNKPTEAQLRSKANQYITEHGVGVPDVSLDVDFSGTEAEQDINLCDIVKVDFEKLGITASAKCIHLTYDVLNERVLSVKLGNYKNTFIDTVTDQMKGITEFASLTPTEIENSIRSITDNGYGYVLLHSSTNTAHIDEILILCDSPNINTAQKIWRWNKNGLGYSSTGYNGTYGLAMTMLGQIVASMVKTGTLRAIQINNSGDNFYVTPTGVMTAKSGYIGSSSTGFAFTDSQIKNSKIVMYARGLGILNNGTELGHFGRTDGTYTKTDPGQLSPDPGDIEPDYEDYRWWLSPSQVADRPGIGVCINTGAKGLTFSYYDSDQSTNISYLRYTQSGGDDSNTHNNAFDIYCDINMNNHAFAGFIDRVTSRYYATPEYNRTTIYKTTPIGGGEQVVSHVIFRYVKMRYDLYRFGTLGGVTSYSENLINIGEYDMKWDPDF